MTVNLIVHITIFLLQAVCHYCRFDSALNIVHCTLYCLDICIYMNFVKNKRSEQIHVFVLFIEILRFKKCHCTEAPVVKK